MLRLGFLLVELPAFVLLLSRAGGPPTAGEDPAVRAARIRQEAVRTLDVRFKRTEVTRKGALTSPAPARSRPPMPMPPKDMTLEWMNRLVFDRDKFRIETSQPISMPDTGYVGKREILGSFDGTTPKLFFPHGTVESAGGPTGFIEKEPRQVIQWMVDHMPITTAFRGVSPSLFGLTVDQLEPTGARLMIDGSLCREYAPKRPPKIPSRYWLDTDKDYVLRRVLWQGKEFRVATQLDVQYRRDPTAGWVPASWTTKGFRQDGEVWFTVTVEVLSLSVNAPQAPEQFDLTFPPGTYVADHRADEKKEYFVQPDGSLGELPKEMKPQPVGELPKPGKAKTPEGAPQGPWYKGDGWLLAGVTLILLALGLAYLWQKKRSNARRGCEERHQSPER
jgi:hypothetical protein